MLKTCEKPIEFSYPIFKTITVYLCLKLHIVDYLHFTHFRRKLGAKIAAQKTQLPKYANFGLFFIDTAKLGLFGSATSINELHSHEGLYKQKVFARWCAMESKRIMTICDVRQWRTRGT